MSSTQRTALSFALAAVVVLVTPASATFPGKNGRIAFIQNTGTNATYGTLVKSQGADVATTQALMRHANASITMDRYVQAVTLAKREAQSRVVNSHPFPRR